MSFRQFTHETRSVARDTLWAALVPTVLVLLTFALWQGEFNREGLWFRLLTTVTGAKLFVFFDTGWAYVGWLVPWWLLRGSRLRDETALWRTGPVGKWTYFGARLNWVLCMTVLLPTAVAGLVCAVVTPVLAIDQMVPILWIQFTLFCTGVFAAFVAKGDRGVWITAGLGVLWYVGNMLGEEATQWIFRRWILHVSGESNVFIQREYEFPGWGTTWSRALTWPAIVAWVGIPVVVILWIPFAIRNAARRARWWPWIPFVLIVSLVAEGSFLLSDYRRPTYPGTDLPVVRMTMETGAPPKEASRYIGDPLGWCRVTLPEPAMHLGNPTLEEGWAEYWGKNSLSSAAKARVSGVWHCGDLSRPITFQSENRYLDAYWRAGDVGLIPLPKYSYNESVVAGLPGLLRPLKDTFGRSGIRLWTALGGGEWYGDSSSDASKLRFDWVDTAAPVPPQTVWFGFSSPWITTPDGRSSKQEIPDETFRGKTVGISVKMRAWRELPPVIIGRVPVLRGGEFVTPKGWRMTVAPALFGDTNFQVKYGWRAGPVELRPKMPENYSRDAPERYQAMLYNAKAAQAVLLTIDGPISNRDFNGYRMPAHAPSLSHEWFADAELVMLEYKDEPVTLPLELTLKVPAQK